MRDTTGPASGMRELSKIGGDGASGWTRTEDGIPPPQQTLSPVESDGTEFFDAHEAMPWSPERPSTRQSPAAIAARRMKLAPWPVTEQNAEEGGGGGGGGSGKASSALESADIMEPKVCGYQLQQYIGVNLSTTAVLTTAVVQH